MYTTTTTTIQYNMYILSLSDRIKELKKKWMRRTRRRRKETISIIFCFSFIQRPLHFLTFNIKNA